MKSKVSAWALLAAGVVFGAAACGGSGGGEAGGGHEPGGTGGGEPGGSGGGSGLIENEACHACGETACAGAFNDCKSAGTCLELVDCLLGCVEGDETCAQDCAAGYHPNDAGHQEAAGAAATYWACVLGQCLEECVVVPDGGVGGDGVPLQPMNGSISGDNPAGIEGSFFVIADDGAAPSRCRRSGPPCASREASRRCPTARRATAGWTIGERSWG